MRERGIAPSAEGSAPADGKDQPKNPGRRRFLGATAVFFWGAVAGMWGQKGLNFKFEDNEKRRSKEYNDLFGEMIESLRQKTDIMLLNAEEQRWHDAFSEWTKINDFLKREKELFQKDPEIHERRGLRNVLNLMEQNIRLAGLALTYIIERNRRSVSIKDKYSFDKLDNELLLFFDSFNRRHQPGGVDYRGIPEDHEDPAIAI
jgi:hypothetical protein